MFKKILAIFLLVLAILFVLYICIFGREILLAWLMQRGILFEEVSRLSSPDGNVDAVLMSHDGGATTSLSYLLYIVPAGEKMTKQDMKSKIYRPVFDADHMEGRNIFWLHNKVLEIQYNKARIFSFRNHIRPLKEDYSYVVEIRETPLTAPPSLIEQDRK